MPRQARVISNTNIYHIMLRGNNKQKIFFDDADCFYFIKVLKDCKPICGFSLYAYCLMPNHIHLLIGAGGEPICKVMKRIGVRYVKWYNEKYGRCGHLFQDRFKSEVVMDYSYFFTVLRYILQNPVKAGLCSTVTSFKYSSANDYFLGGGVTDTSFAYNSYRGSDLKKFINTENSDKCLDEDNKMSDCDAASLICQKYDLKSPCELRNIQQELMSAAFSELLESGIQIRQLARLTGISTCKIYYCKNKTDTA